MRDVFGAEGITTDGTTAADPGVAAMAAGMGGMTATAATPTAITPVAAAPTGAKAPTLQQAVDKAVAKAGADAKVATDPNAVHSVRLAVAAPIVVGATAAGALIGSAILPGPGTAIGAGVGWLTERYQIAGGPWGRLWGWTKGKVPLLQKTEDAIKSGARKATGA